MVVFASLQALQRLRQAQIQLESWGGGGGDLNPVELEGWNPVELEGVGGDFSEYGKQVQCL